MYINIFFVAIISIRSANIKYKINIYYNLNLKNVPNVAIKAYILRAVYSCISVVISLIFVLLLSI